MKYDISINLKKKIIPIFKDNFTNLDKFEKNIVLKEDRSLVTAIDLQISEIIKEFTATERLKNNISFFCEEDHGELIFPAFILDPIDGTNELIKRIGECAISLAYMHSKNLDDTRSWAWIYNPFTGFELMTGQDFYSGTIAYREHLTGLVSRSEYRDGLFDNFACDNLSIHPRGSIAFKLGLLASGACDFVISRRPKNIWDIAAGTLLCRERGIHLYSDGVEINLLSEVRMNAPLLWCSPVNLGKIK